MNTAVTTYAEHSDTLTTYDELIAVLAALPMLVREKRRRCRLTLREAAEQADVAFSVMHRLERGESGPNHANLLALLRWVGHPDGTR